MHRLNIVKDLYSRSLLTIRNHANKINGSIVWKRKITLEENMGIWNVSGHLETNTVYAKSVKSNTVLHSSCESETKAIDAAIIQTIWMRGFLAELSFPQTKPTVFYTDSASAIDLGELFRVGKNSIHVTIMRLNFIHECIQDKTVCLKYINGDLRYLYH